MEIKPLYKCTAALDVHQAQLTVCILMEKPDGVSGTQKALVNGDTLGLSAQHRLIYIRFHSWGCC